MLTTIYMLYVLQTEICVLSVVVVANLNMQHKSKRTFDLATHDPHQLHVQRGKEDDGNDISSHIGMFCRGVAASFDQPV